MFPTGAYIIDTVWRHDIMKLWCDNDGLTKFFRCFRQPITNDVYTRRVSVSRIDEITPQFNKPVENSMTWPVCSSAHGRPLENNDNRYY